MDEASKIVKKLIGQVIGSTHRDSQGEKLPKEILEHICGRRQVRSPISQSHQPEKPSIGYMENFRVVPDPNDSEEWFLLADIYFIKEPDDVDIALGGFSWSITKLIKEYSCSNSEYAIYLPYPFYTDKNLLKDLANKGKKLSLGRWYKKSADPTKISLAVSFILFVLSPVWAKFFNNTLWPKIKIIWEIIPDLRHKGVQRVDFVQVAKINSHQVSIYFIPEANKEEICFSKDKIKNGFNTVYEYSKTDPKSKSIGFHVAKLYWESQKEEYKLFHIEYKDGTDINIA